MLKRIVEAFTVVCILVLFGKPHLIFTVQMVSYLIPTSIFAIGPVLYNAEHN